jgi:murein L,D-transpeptidase YafK
VIYKLKYLFVLLLATTNAFANSYPAHIFTRDVTDTTTILVDKQAKIAHLIELENDVPKVTKQYVDLMFGENDGHKVREGDKRTPEGVYQINNFLVGSELDARYGSGAFPLNFPNPADKIEGRNGSGIWLHGRDDDDLNKIVTRGCVAFTNEDILELQQLLPEKTGVIISPKAEFLSVDAYQKERERVLGILDTFINDWESGNFDSLQGQLHPKFKSANGQPGDSWLKRKKWIYQATPRRTINTDGISAMKEDADQIVFDFTQSYCAKNIYTRGQKKLFFKRDGDKLKLITERYSPLEPLPISQDAVRQFVTHWLNSWNKGEIGRYIASYDDSFIDSRGRNLKAFNRYKKGIFDQRPDQRIEIGDITVSSLTINKFRVQFEQHYTSKAYTDIGNKTLIINACTDDMRIEKETWSKL